MEVGNHEFDLSTFITDTLCLDGNLTPHAKNQHEISKEDSIVKLLRKDPRDALGFNSFNKPRDISENIVGTTIQEFYRGLNVFITGGTGFLGKILIEKLIRSVPHIGQIYVLVRAKKGVPAEERFGKLLEDEVFLRMRTEVPDYQSKLTCVEGDISEPDLGLSQADRQILLSQVHVVFHSAADVRFFNSLRASVNSNLLGSKRVIDLAKGMRNLKSYIHVSTAYSNCVRRVIEEKCYKVGVSHTEILKILEEKSDDEIINDEERILQGWPNTYTFSKALCEDMISEEAKDLPICIFRPSIVWPTYKEPLRGWTDNVYGPNGMLMAIALGVFHITMIERSLPVDTVPVDFTANAMIAIAWENATDRINSMPVYNFTSSPRTPVIWKTFEVVYTKWLDAYPFQQAIWYVAFITTTNATFEKVGNFFLHKIPGLVLDRIAVATGREPRLTKIYNKLTVLKEKINKLVFTVWEFQTENITLLFNKLSEEDKKLFYFDIAEMNNIPEYLLVGRLGIKYFYLKESLEKMPDAARKSSWLKLAHRLLLVVSSLAALKLLVTLARILPI